jgi:hypothetical protein
MRSYWAPSVFIGLTFAAHGLWGQIPTPPPQAPSPYFGTATILASQVDVSSGPGSGPATPFYPTSRLRYNDRVTVLGESKKQPGWLEIVPPQHSYSWIDARYVKPIPGAERTGVVDTGDPQVKAPIMPGSSIVSKEPIGQIAQVETGTLLVLLDRPTATSGGAKLYPIMPVATEVRFIPLDAVRGGSFGANTAGYGQTIPTSWQNTAGPAPNAIPFHEIAKQGDQAVAAGNPERARILYIEAIAQTNDPAWRNYLAGRLNQLSPNSGAQNAPVQVGSSPNVRPVGPANWSPNAAAPVGPAGPPTAPVKTWSPWGILRGAGITLREGTPLYRLEDKTGNVLQYITTQPGGTLNDYITQTISVYGAVTTRNDLNIEMRLITAEQIATPPAGAK